MNEVKRKQFRNKAKQAKPTVKLLTEKMAAKNTNKQLYSMANLEGTYDDLVVFFNDKLAAKDYKAITKYDVVEFLKGKNRVPAGILKKNKAPYVEQPKCIARNLKEHKQCGNESKQGDHHFCQVHINHPPRFTMEDSVEEIEAILAQELAEKKAKKKAAAKEKKKAAKKAKKAKKKAEKEAAEASEDEQADNTDDAEGSEAEVSDVKSEDLSEIDEVDQDSEKEEEEEAAPAPAPKPRARKKKEEVAEVEDDQLSEGDEEVVEEAIAPTVEVDEFDFDEEDESDKKTEGGEEAAEEDDEEFEFDDDKKSEAEADEDEEFEFDE